MEKYKKYGLLLLLCLVVKAGFGQTSLPFVRPDRLTILDFWATWCSGCLRTFPAEDSLQAAFGDSLAIVLVNARETQDSPAAIKKALGKYPHLQSVTGDTAATLLFPHALLPHYVWLRHDSVLGITGPEAITPARIRAVLAGSVVLPAKKDIRVDFTRPLLSPLGAQSGDYLIITGEIPGLPGALTMFSADGRSTGISCLNKSIPGLYRAVMPALAGMPLDHITCGDSSYYCYERIVQPMARDSLLALARSDLDRYFRMAGRFVRKDGALFYIIEPIHH